MHSILVYVRFKGDLGPAQMPILSEKHALSRDTSFQVIAFSGILTPQECAAAS